MSRSFTCPNINSPEWKALVKHYKSEKKAWKLYASVGDVPIIEVEIDDKYGERLFEALQVIDRRIKVLNAKTKEAPESLRNLHQNMLKNLTQQGNNISYKASLISFLDTFSAQIEDMGNTLKDLDNMSHADKVSSVILLRKYIMSMMPILKDIQKDLIDSDDEVDQQILAKVTSEILIMEKYSTKVKKEAVPIAAKLLSHFIGSRNDPEVLAKINKNLPADKQVKEIDIEELIMRAEHDIPFLSRWLDSMSDTNDDLLKLVNEVVATAKVRARLQGEGIRKRLVTMRNELFASGTKNFEFVFERENGKLTGNFIEAFERRRFDKDVNDFFKEINKRYGVKVDKSELEGEKLKAYLKEVDAWYQESTEINPEYDGMIQAMREAVKDFDKDVQERRMNFFKAKLQEDHKNKIGKEFYTPKYSKYGNKTFANMTSQEKAFYDELIKIKNELDELLPRSLTHGKMVPMVPKDFLERATSLKGMKDFSEMFSTLTQVKDFDTELGDKNTEQANLGKVDTAQVAFVLRDVNKDVGFLPIYFTKRMENIESNLSLDIVSSMVLYSNMANDYGEMNKVIDELELIRDLAKERKVVRTNWRGKQEMAVSRVGGTTTLEELYVENPKSLERLDDYFSMVIYGRMRKEGYKIDMFGKEIDVEKTLDTLGKFTAVNQLALNLFAGVANVTYGNTMMRVEALAGKYGAISTTNLNNGTINYGAGLPGFVGEIGKVDMTNKLGLWMERFNVLQDFEQDSKETNAIRRTRIAKLFGTSAMFFTSRVGEHFMQGRMSLALADKQKLLLDGKEITLYDAYEVQGNRLVLKKGVTKLDGKQWTMEDEIRFIRKQDFINQRLNGIYNDTDKSAVQAMAIGRLATMFRKFIVPGFHRRFDPLNFNYMDDMWHEGTYTTFKNFFKVMLEDIKAGQFSLMKNWNELNDEQKGNMIRNLGELSALIATLVLLGFLGSGDDGDRDKWWWNMAAYTAYRMRSDLLFYINPGETLKILNSPAAATGQLTNLANFVELTLTSIAPWNWGDWDEEEFILQSGSYKGWNKWAKSAWQTFPTVRTIHNTINPEERMIYWMR